MEKKVHYTLHKVKKSWVAVAVSTLSIAALTGVSGETVVLADQVDAQAQVDRQASDQTTDTVAVDLTTDTAGQSTTDQAVATGATIQDDASQTQAPDQASDQTTTEASVSTDSTTTTVGTDSLVDNSLSTDQARTSLVRRTRAVSDDTPTSAATGHTQEIGGKTYLVDDQGNVLKNYVVEKNGGSQYFNNSTGELTNQKAYWFGQDGGSTVDPNNPATKGDKNALYSTSEKDVETVDGYFTAETWYRPKEILKDGTTWTASTADDKRPLLSVWWPSKDIQAKYLNYMARQGLGTDQNFTSASDQATMNQAAQDIQKAIEVRIGKEGTAWLRATISDFVKTQPGWSIASENYDTNDHLQGGALLFNSDNRTTQANSDYRLLNRTPTNQTGVHNPKYTADMTNGGFEFLLANDIDNSNPVVQAEQLNWLHYIMNIGSLTGGDASEDFDGLRVDAVDNVDADLLQIASDYMKARYKIDQSEADSIKHLSIQEAWSHNDPYYTTDMKDAQLPMDDLARLSMVFSLLRPINGTNGARSGLEPLIDNSLNPRSAGKKNTDRRANYTFVRAHDSEVQTVIGEIIKREINTSSTGNTFTLDEMKKAFEIYNADMRSATKRYTQYNIPSAYALMLSNKDVVPRVYYGDMYTDDGQYMAQESPYHKAIETLLKARIKYVAGGQDMQMHYDITSSRPSELSGWTPADILTSVRYGKGADSATDAGTAETRTQGMAVILASNPTMKLTGTLKINMGAAHKNQAYRPLLKTSSQGLDAYLNDSDTSLVKYTDENGYLIFTAGEIEGTRNPQVDGYLAVWVPVGASEGQDARTQANNQKNNNGLVYTSSAALDSQVIYEGFSNFQDFVQNDAQYTNKIIAQNAGLFASWGITSFEFPPQYVSSTDGTFLDSVIQNGYAFSDRYDIAMSQNNKYGSLADLKAALKAVHEHGMSAIADWVPDQIYNLPGDEVVTATRVNNYGKTKDGALINHSLYAAKTRTKGDDYQGKYGGKYLDELKALYPQIFERVQVSTGKTIDGSEKITAWSAKYMNGSNILGRGADYVLKNSAGTYLSTRDGNLNLPLVLASGQGNNQNQTDGKGRFVRRLGSAYYYYTDGNMARNTFIQDSKGNVYYFNNRGRMVTGQQTIKGKSYYFLANGVQLRNGYRQDTKGHVTYYDAQGVLSKDLPSPQPQPDIKGRFEQIGDNVWVYLDQTGKRVTGRQIINGQNLYFDQDGIQAKGRAVTVDGVLRYYDVNSGEMIINRFEQIGDNVWAYFGNDGAALKGLQHINGQTLYFDQEGRQVKGRTAVVDGQTRYFDANSGEMIVNRFEQIGNNVWAYFDQNGNAVKGRQTINGQDLYFDQDGKQVKGRAVTIDGSLYYYDADSGEMAKNRWVEISQGVWRYFDAQGRSWT